MNKHLSDFIRENSASWNINNSSDIALLEGRNLPGSIISNGLISNILNESYGYCPLVPASSGPPVQALSQEPCRDLSRDGDPKGFARQWTRCPHCAAACEKIRSKMAKKRAWIQS